MAYKIVRSVESDRDLDLIFEHLLESYISFGETLNEAFERASKRVNAIYDELDLLELKPHKGTLLPELGAGVRGVTKNKVVTYFIVDETQREVRILAFFLVPRIIVAICSRG